MSMSGMQEDLDHWRDLVSRRHTELEKAAEVIANVEASNDALRDQLAEREELLAKEYRRWWPRFHQAIIGAYVLVWLACVVVTVVKWGENDTVNHIASVALVLWFAAVPFMGALSRKGRIWRKIHDRL